jgi:hypothetical protein
MLWEFWMDPTAFPTGTESYFSLCSDVLLHSRHTVAIQNMWLKKWMMAGCTGDFQWPSPLSPWTLPIEHFLNASFTKLWIYLSLYFIFKSHLIRLSCLQRFLGIGFWAP